MPVARSAKLLGCSAASCLGFHEAGNGQVHLVCIELPSNMQAATRNSRNARVYTLVHSSKPLAVLGILFVCFSFDFQGLLSSCCFFQRLNGLCCSPRLNLRELGPWSSHMRWIIWIMASVGTVYVFFFHER